MKNFAKSKNSRMFAVLSTKSILRTFIALAFFCANTTLVANNIGYQIPVVRCAVRSVNAFGRAGGDSLSCIHIVTNNFIHNMTKSNEITNSVNNSNGIGTPYGAKSVLSANQTNNNGCNVSGNVKSIKIINGISADQLQTVIKTLFKEFIDSGLITLLSNAKNDTL